MSGAQTRLYHSSTDPKGYAIGSPGPILGLVTLYTVNKRARLEITLEESIVGNMTEAYVSALAGCMDPPRNSALEVESSRNRHDQEGFRERLIVKYNAKGPNGNNYWCPVSHQYFFHDMITAAHIVPRGLGEDTAAHLLGVDRSKGWEVLWTTGNGLILRSAVEQAFDHGEVVIVPWKDQASNDVPGEYRAIVLGEKIRGRPSASLGEPDWKNIDGRKLAWKNDFRPNARYLYFHYIYTLLRRQRFDLPGWFEDRVRIPMGQVWATPGKWLRRGTILALAAEVGEFADPDSFLKNAKGTFPTQNTQEEAEVEAAVAVAIRDAMESEKDDDEYEQAA